MAIGDIAAKLLLPVFPCGEDKRPVVAGGFKSASIDPAAIREAFNRPGAVLIGMPTGEVSGIVVIDVDIKPGRDGREWLKENEYALPETRTHKTMSGGLHLLFKCPEGVDIRNSAGRLAPGVDVRGSGGYAILPPSPGYSVADPTEPADMPRWLIKACMRQEPEPAPAPRYDGPRTDHPYVRAALDNECDRVASAGEGTRNDTLNTAALKLGHYVGAGYLSRGEAESRLLNAAKDAGLPHREAVATIKSGLDAGERDPKAPPERERPATQARHEPQPDKRPTAPQPPDAAPLPLEFFVDMKMSEDVADFVEGLLIEAAMSVIYGQSNSGKTFWLLHLALCVAAGIPWNGREVTQGPVIWLAMEGAYGIRNRVEAWKRHHGMEDANVPFAVVPVALDLLNPDASTQDLIATIAFVAAKFEAPVKLTVVDTLSRAISGGNENSPEDMGSLVTNGTKIQQATKSHLSWIHHSGKDDAKGARGHSLLRAATDTEIEITADGAQRMARVSKQRELDCAGEFAFTLKVIDLGNNKRGKPVTSCVVDNEDIVTTSVATPRLKGHSKRAMDTLHDLLAESGKTGFPGVPSGVPSIPEEWWRERFYDRTASDGKADVSQNGKRMAFNRAAQELVEKRLAGLNKGRVWAVRPAQTPTVDETS